MKVSESSSNEDPKAVLRSLAHNLRLSATSGLSLFAS